MLVIHDFCCHLIGLFKISPCLDFCCDACSCEHSGFVFDLGTFFKTMFPFIKDAIEKKGKPYNHCDPFGRARTERGEETRGSRGQKKLKRSNFKSISICQILTKGTKGILRIPTTTTSTTTTSATISIEVWRC